VKVSVLRQLWLYCKPHALKLVHNVHKGISTFDMGNEETISINGILLDVWQVLLHGSYSDANKPLVSQVAD